MSWLRPRARMSRGCTSSSTRYGIAFDDIDVFYLAGGFGRHLNVEASKRIGLVPSLAPEKIRAGPAILAIEGATIALLSKVEAPGIGRAGEKSGTLPAGNPSELLRFLCGGLPVQSRGADSMRQVAEAIELADTLPAWTCSQQEYMRLLGYPRGWVLEGRAENWRIGPGLVCEEWPAMVLCAAGGEPRIGERRASGDAIGADRFRLMEWSSTASACTARSSRPRHTTQFWLPLVRALKLKKRRRRRWERRETRRIFLPRGVCLRGC